MKPRRARSMIALALLATSVTGCSAVGGFFSYGDNIEVTEVRRLTVCNSYNGASKLTLLSSPEAIREWQTQRGIDLFGDGDAGPALPAGPFALVEHGIRNTGGFGIAVSRQAVAAGSELSIYATYLSPGENQMRTQMVTSPCVLVALPAGSHYSALKLIDQSGAVRARFPDNAPLAASPAVVPAQ